jgi:hypothetical protein
MDGKGDTENTFSAGEAWASRLHCWRRGPQKRLSVSLVGDLSFWQDVSTNVENSVEVFKKFHRETGKAISDSDAKMVCDFIMLTANYDDVQDVVRAPRISGLVDAHCEMVPQIRTFASRVLPVPIEFILKFPTAMNSCKHCYGCMRNPTLLTR